MNEVTIRRAQIADLPIIYNYICDLVQEELDRTSFDQCYRECIDAPRHHYLVACVDDRVVGYIACHGALVLHYAGYAYEIHELYVHAKYRNLQIGKKLLDAIEVLARSEGCKLLVVASNMRRVDAHRFYLSNGFAQTTYKFKKKLEY